MKNPLFIFGLLFSAVLAVAMTIRIHVQSANFTRIVQASKLTTEGYDKNFIDLVNRLESVLTIRAGFGYTGTKDPMTGKLRSVVHSEVRPDTHIGAKKIEDTSDRQVVDHVRLTAIIQDDNGRYTAVVMAGERSLSVDIGDVVQGRRVIQISAGSVTMENDSTLFKYDIEGGKFQKSKKEAKP